MSKIKEITEDLNSVFNENIFYGARKEYIFDGYPFIIGAHGAGLNGWNRAGMRTLMNENNFGGVLMILDFLNKGFEGYMQRLDKEIEKYPNPTLVMCSASGFLGLEWARTRGWDKINKIVTIATPFNGSPKVFKFFSPIIAETTKGEALLNYLLALKPPEGKVVSIFAKEDRFIPYPEKIKLNWPKIITDAKSHGDVQNHQIWFKDALLAAVIK